MEEQHKVNVLLKYDFSRYHPSLSKGANGWCYLELGRLFKRSKDRDYVSVRFATNNDDVIQVDICMQDLELEVTPAIESLMAEYVASIREHKILYKPGIWLQAMDQDGNVSCKIWDRGLMDLVLAAHPDAILVE